MATAFILSGVFVFVSGVVAVGPVPVQRGGLAGINGFKFYDPVCAHACFRSFSAFTLSCTEEIMAGGHTTGDQMAHDIAVCRSTNYPFLSSVAWCIHIHCPSDVGASLIERYWENEVTGFVAVPPKWTYGETIAKIREPPHDVLVGTGELNGTVLTTQKVFEETQQTLVYYFRETALESVYGLATCLAIFIAPVLLTWSNYIPYAAGAIGRLKPYVYSSIFGTYHDRPLPFAAGNVPTIAQSLFIALAVILNVVFISVGYSTLYPGADMQWYTNHYQELMFYVCLRTGAMAFCLMPVLVLFSSRNNILLWLTNWSHSTYLLFHRWIARIFLIQTLLHSILALVLWIDVEQYEETLAQPFWIWGCVATVATVAIMLTSGLILRRRSYELFLVTHIILAVICVVGCWYHIQFEYEFTFGYETWLYATIAVWFFDRLARVGRLLNSGIKFAKVSELSTGILRVDVPGIHWAVSPGKRVHVYFPTVTRLRPWENHPFSTIPTALLSIHASNKHEKAPGSNSEAETTCIAAMTHPKSHETDNSGGPCTNSGLTMFIRKAHGMTSHLKENHRLLTFLEGPYQNNGTKALLRCDRLLLIGGGIGITGLLSFLDFHRNVKLMYSVKQEDVCLLNTLNHVLERVEEKVVLVGQRLELEAMLREEACIGWSKIGVVVCGPVGMCDDTRAIVARIARDTAGVCSFELEVDSFLW